MRLYLRYKGVRATRYPQSFFTRGIRSDLNQGIVVAVIALNVLLSAMVIYFFKAQNFATSKCKLSLHCQIAGCLLWHEVNLLIRITKHIIQIV